jgi:uncharacterized protein (UPF0305 family)
MKKTGKAMARKEAEVPENKIRRMRNRRTRRKRTKNYKAHCALFSTILSTPLSFIRSFPLHILYVCCSLTVGDQV